MTAKLNGALIELCVLLGAHSQWKTALLRLTDSGPGGKMGRRARGFGPPQWDAHEANEIVYLSNITRTRRLL